MKISEMIKQLSQIKDECGDLDLYSNEYSNHCEIDNIEVLPNSKMEGWWHESENPNPPGYFVEIY